MYSLIGLLFLVMRCWHSYYVHRRRALVLRRPTRGRTIRGEGVVFSRAAQCIQGIVYGHNYFYIYYYHYYRCRVGACGAVVINSN